MSIFDLFKKIEQPKIAVEWIIFGLGNPGKKYGYTRHNCGFKAVDYIAGVYDIKMNNLKFSAVCGEGVINNTGVCLIKPQTFMNLSGQSVLEALAGYKLENTNIIVIYDDISMEVGKLRVRDKGSSGGHKGIKSIIECINTDVFQRIKIGVGMPAHKDYEITDWVLSSFSEEDAKTVDETIKTVPAAIEKIISGT